MTDFLTDLLERSRGQGVGLAPRTPSIFEPAGGEGLQPADEEPTGAERTPPTELSRPAAAWPDDPAPAPIGRQPIADVVVPRTEPVGEIPRGVAEVGARRIEPVSRSSHSARPYEAAAPLEGERRLLPHAVDAQTTGLRQREDRPHLVTPEVPAAAPERTDEKRTVGVQRTDELRPVDEPPPPQPGALSMPPQLGTLTAPPVRSEAPSRLVGDPTPPPEPTVHVTIGRVEIRAVTAPAPPARRPPDPQAMSLDDYLSERNRRRQA